MKLGQMFVAALALVTEASKNGKGEVSPSIVGMNDTLAGKEGAALQTMLNLYSVESITVGAKGTMMGVSFDYTMEFKPDEAEVLNALATLEGVIKSLQPEKPTPVED